MLPTPKFAITNWEEQTVEKDLRSEQPDRPIEALKLNKTALPPKPLIPPGPLEHVAHPVLATSASVKCPKSPPPEPMCLRSVEFCSLMCIKIKDIVTETVLRSWATSVQTGANVEPRVNASSTIITMKSMSTIL